MTNALETSLNQLVELLVAKRFVFFQPESSVSDMQEYATAYDKYRTEIFNRLTGLVMMPMEGPDLLKKILNNIMRLGTEKIDDEMLTSLHELIESHFLVCALGSHFSLGPRFVAILVGDEMSYDEIMDALSHFEKINLLLMQVGGRWCIKVLGKTMLRMDYANSTGSMIILTSSTDKFNLLRQWLKDRPLRCDTVINQLRKFQVRPQQIRQEVVIWDVKANQAISTVAPRISFEFGFSLNDLVKQ